MGSYYRLSILCDVEIVTKIESILGKSDDEVGWNLIIDETNPSYSNALNIFIDLISDNLTLLKGLGITEEMITFWYMYEYEQQCNMEFWPEIMKKMGNLGIVLCISCWEK